MGKIEELFNRANRIGEIIDQEAREKKNIIVLGHLDADGIASASIIAKAILRKNGRFIVRIINNLKPKTVYELKEEGYDFYIFCELGAGIGRQIKEVLDDKWIVIDHHQIDEDEKNIDNVINSWQFDIDGTREISAAGMSYIVALTMGKNNMDLSYLAIIGALGDKQDQGEGRSLIGLNKIIMKDAIESGCLKVTEDLMFYGRETKPIHEAIASTTTPFIPGLTGNRDSCLATLTSAGIRLKEGSRWRTIAELSEEEKGKVVEAIIPYLTLAPNATDKVKELIGNIYTLEKEDEHTPLRDCREFATLLNACGRTGNGGVGVSICLGDRDFALQEGERILVEYKHILNNYVQNILSDGKRVIEGKWSFIIAGDGLIDEKMLGAVSSILSGIAKFEGKVLFVKTVTSDGDVSFSARKTKGCNPTLNLGLIMAEASKFEGVGGGHDAAAGARIPFQKSSEFLKVIEDRLWEVNESKGKDTN